MNKPHPHCRDPPRWAAASPAPLARSPRGPQSLVGRHHLQRPT